VHNSSKPWSRHMPFMKWKSHQEPADERCSFVTEFHILTLPGESWSLSLFLRHAILRRIFQRPLLPRHPSLSSRALRRESQIVDVPS
jgi:hypothetical protein